MWTPFVAADRVGVRLGEIRNATDRLIKLRWKGVPSIEFAVRADDRMQGALRSLDKTLLTAHDDSTGARTIRFCGPVVNYDKHRAKDDGTIKITAAGAGWRLSKRTIGQSAVGATWGTTPTVLVDKGEIAALTIDALNVGENTNIFTVAGDTGIRRGTIASTVKTFAGPWRFKQALQTLTDLSSGLDGFEYEIAPTEPAADALGVQLGLLNIAPVIGIQRPNAVFEFGSGRLNVEDWHEVGNADALCNRALNLPPGFPDNIVDPVLVKDDAAAIADRGVLYEDVIPGDFASADLRSKITQLNVDVRKQPKLVIAFTPIAEAQDLPIEERRVPRLFVDYNIGDIIPFRAFELFPVLDALGGILGYELVKTVDAWFRVYGVDIKLDDAGVAAVTPMLVEEG